MRWNGEDKCRTCNGGGSVENAREMRKAKGSHTVKKKRCSFDCHAYAYIYHSGLEKNKENVIFINPSHATI